MNQIFKRYSDELQGTRPTYSQASSNKAAVLCMSYLRNICLHCQAKWRDRLLQTVRYRSHKEDVNRGLDTVVYFGVQYKIIQLWMLRNSGMTLCRLVEIWRNFVWTYFRVKTEAVASFKSLQVFHNTTRLHIRQGSVLQKFRDLFPWMTTIKQVFPTIKYSLQYITDTAHFISHSR